MSTMKDDLSLLREFVRDRSDSAFEELVRRHIDLVHTAALRQLGGDADLARDATQAVFCELARQARKLHHRALAGWLYTTARFVAARLRRTEARRDAREIAFVMKNTDDFQQQESWHEVELLLDDAMHEISATDREAVILRYFRNEPLAAIAAALGSTENAARMRVDRALEKLRAVLAKRGIRRSSAVLAALLSTHTVLGAPAGLSGLVANSILATAGTAAWAGSFLNFMSAIKIKTALGCLALAGTTTGLILSQNQGAKLEFDLARVRDQAQTQPAQNSPPTDPSLALVDAGELARLRNQKLELMRLRDEVTKLRDQLRNMPDPASARPPTVQADPAAMQKLQEQARKTIGIAKMNVAKGWGLAFHLFAKENDGRMPADFHEAAAYYPQIPEEISWMHELAGDDFEIVFRGSLHAIENPAQAIILREKEPDLFDDDGSAQRTYLFADGHSEIHKAANGDFEPWEIQHQPILRANSAFQSSREPMRIPNEY